MVCWNPTFLAVAADPRLVLQQCQPMRSTPFDMQKSTAAAAVMVTPSAWSKHCRHSSTIGAPPEAAKSQTYDRTNPNALVLQR